MPVVECILLLELRRLAKIYGKDLLCKAWNEIIRDLEGQLRSASCLQNATRLDPFLTIWIIKLIFIWGMNCTENVDVTYAHTALSWPCSRGNRYLLPLNARRQRPKIKYEVDTHEVPSQQ